MTTIKIKPTHPSQGEFVVIEKAAFDPSTHEMLEGESLGDTNGDAGDGAPTLAELIASRNQLLARNDELDERERALVAHQEHVAALLRENEAEAERIVEQAKANEAEAQRLRSEAASLQAAKDAFAAQAQVAAAPAAAATSTEKPTKGAKA